MAKIPFGPNYDEMLDPGLLDQDVRARALAALKQNELDPDRKKSVPPIAR